MPPALDVNERGAEEQREPDGLGDAWQREEWLWKVGVLKEEAWTCSEGSWE